MSSPTIDNKLNKLDDQIHLEERIYVPVKEHPKFNFVGKLLGPQGNTLKRLQAQTQCRIAIFGKGSMRNKEKEEELKKSGEEKYAHLNDDLHVYISVKAIKREAHKRLANALAEIEEYLKPEKGDHISELQMQEMEAIKGGYAFENRPTINSLRAAHAGRQVMYPGTLPANLPPGTIIIPPQANQAKGSFYDEYSSSYTVGHEDSGYERSSNRFDGFGGKRPGDSYPDERPSKQTRINFDGTLKRNYSGENYLLEERLYFPVDLFPRYNWAGKILGSQGSNIKRMQEETQTRMMVLGKGSVHKQKAAELLQSGDPKYEHLREPLHLYISAAKCHRHEAHMRIADALEQVCGSLTTDEGTNFNFERERDTLCNGLAVVEEKIYLPVSRYPKVNFMGKILGPGAENLKKIQNDSQTKMMVLGRGSVRDRNKLDELIESGDPKYDHLHDDMHVKISAKCRRVEAFRRVGEGCKLIQPFLVPTAEEIEESESRSDYHQPAKRRSTGFAGTPLADERGDHYHGGESSGYGGGYGSSRGSEWGSSRGGSRGRGMARGGGSSRGRTPVKREEQGDFYSRTERRGESPGLMNEYLNY